VRPFDPDNLVRLSEQATHAVAHRVVMREPVRMACGWKPSQSGVLMTADKARTRWQAFFCRRCWR